MKKTLIVILGLFIFVMVSWCSNQKDAWQGAYYDEWTDDSDIVYWPIFTNYNGCKDRAISREADAYNNYVFCSKNCHDSVDGTPVCEEAVRSWAPFSFSMTFDNYRE